MKPRLNIFLSEKILTELIEGYFKKIAKQVKFEDTLQEKPKTPAAPPKKTRAKQTEEPVTITGLALHLGFNSRAEFEAYENRGKFAGILKRARLKVEAVYEKKLHNPTASGAIFALKNLGWTEKPETKPAATTPKTLKVIVTESGPPLASNESEVSF